LALIDTSSVIANNKSKLLLILTIGRTVRRSEVLFFLLGG
jgi:hypothetical protein